MKEINYFLIFWLIVIFVSCKKSPEKIEQEYVDCLSNSNSYDRYKCHYDLDGKNIVLRDGVVLSFDELKDIMGQMFFEGRSRPVTVVHRLINVEKGIPFNVALEIEDRNVNQEMFVDFVNWLNEKAKLFIMLNRNINFIDDKNKPKNILFLFANDKKKFLNSFEYAVKKFNVTTITDETRNEIYKYTNVYKQFNPVAFSFATTLPDYIYDVAYLHIVINKSLGDLDIHKLILHTLFGLYGMNMKYDIGRSDIISYFNKRFDFEINIKYFVYIDYLILTLWSHKDIPAGMEKEDFFIKIEELIFDK